MSNSISSICSISWYYIRKWKKKPEIYMTICCLFIFMQTRVESLKTMIQATEIAVTPFLFPFLFSDAYMILFIMMGAVILFSNAPFLDSGFAVALIRAGRMKWAMGQILYIICTSFCYLLVVFLLSMVLLLPNISWENQWGSIWQTLAQTNAGIKLEMELTVPYQIIVNYQPVQAVIIQFLIAMLVCIFLGLLLFVCNFYFGKGLGISATSFCVLIVTRASSYNSFVLWFTPVYWVNLSEIMQKRISQAPTIMQAITALIILNAVLIAASIHAMNTKDLIS